ncbi:Mis12-domain-containing protein [Russula emetica]|nr:Mis12-domain-containing protein [Russula emetica]
MAQPQQSQRSVSKPTPTVLIPEILSFSPHFLLDDTINIANDGVGRAVDAMEDFLNRWAETRLEREPEWADAADKELEQGLVSFQTLLEFHTDIAFDFFEAWSLRNIFAVTPPDLPLVVPHQACLDLDHQSPEKEGELLAEIDELRRKIENQKYLKRLLTNAARTSRRHTKQAQTRLDRLSFMQPEQLQTLRALAKDTDELHATVSALPPHPHLTNADMHLPGLEPGKRQWEVARKLAQQAQRTTGGSVALDAQETIAATSKEEMAAALGGIEHEDQ